MSDRSPDEPHLPDELTALFAQLGGPAMVGRLQQALSSMGAGGPVNWDLARQVALQIAATGDRPPAPDEHARHEQAQRLAEHWLDQGELPAPPDAGRLAVTSRQEWVNAALVGLRPLVEPVAAAAVGALSGVLGDQLGADGSATVLGGLGFDPAAWGGGLGRLLEPVGAVLMGLQAGQVVGQLSRQLFGQYDLGVPTAQPATAYVVAVNVEEAFAGYGVDPNEVAAVLALHEAAHRRQYHAVPWLTGHVRDLVAAFAAGIEIDPDQLQRLSDELLYGVDPHDPASLQAAMERAAQFRLEPSPAQRRVLERLQGLVCLLQAWAAQEARTAAEGRLPGLARVEEVLRRRRATQGDGERLLASLLGLDLKPDDTSVGERFVASVRADRGPDGLRRALAHPENLPDADELAEPARWLARMAADDAFDPSVLFDETEGDEPGDGRGAG